MRASRPIRSEAPSHGQDLAGYLTVVGTQEDYGELLYRLGYPNREVRQSVNRLLVNRLARGARPAERESRL